MSSQQKPVPVSSQNTPTTFTNALLAGALAGTTVDLSLYPLDTLKTRLQSYQGFLASGGFSGIYRGVGSALVGSAPGAALFFCTYETTKSIWNSNFVPDDSTVLYLGTKTENSRIATRKVGGQEGNMESLGHMASASLGEIAACAVRVPTEVIKQRAQAKQHASSVEALKHILSQRSHIGLRGVWLELYRGWTVTIMREIPFTMIQFPLWEAGKAYRMRHADSGLLERNFPEFSSSINFYEKKPQNHQISAIESGFLGSIAGAVAATITTPLDVLKTRMMLARDKPGMLPLLRQIVRDSGPGALFAGLVPRVAWISVGGAIFLGSYQWGVNTLERGLR